MNPWGNKKADFLKNKGNTEEEWTTLNKLPPVATPPPTFSEAEISAESNSDMLRKRRGRASTILSGQQGSMPNAINVATKILLGM